MTTKEWSERRNIAALKVGEEGREPKIVGGL